MTSARLQKMEWSKLIRGGQRGGRQDQSRRAPTPGPGAPGTPRVGWSPCVDGKLVNMRSFFDAAPEVSKNVPMLIGSVSEEGNRMSQRPTEEEWRANLSKAYGEEKAGAIVTALKKAYPQKKIQTLSYICSGAPGLNGLSIRNRVVQMAGFKHALNAAPAYTYYFTWQTPILDGLPGAWHTAELAILLRQHEALRTRHRQHARSTGVGEEDGVIVGHVCGNRQSRSAQTHLAAQRSENKSDDDLGQRVPHGG